MLRGTGEVRYFDWKTGTGIFHMGLACLKDCDKLTHLFPFTWRHVIDKKIVQEGTILAYSAYPKGEEEQARAKTLSPTWGI
ncbi:hypothetical protein A3B19_02370 [Candidatus Giovannonibacteria bacterium RIFCSPLOWO2_01_FULL_46_32]|uniref:Uncharacterized protein n=1 Tax=Candidatus Giovannonibacteria bacterium RIFCSPLOWO2_01_FULL_46_32 TaxID=1798353 RepID=A0A1F5XIC1_9BACT|nr:MAG: hypothetical protein A3B19_02370 [Candidatus Giovannonibacteria bacterium RIFCSPLOWO2_01_FULL_46_32]